MKDAEDYFVQGLVWVAFIIPGVFFLGYLVFLATAFITKAVVTLAIENFVLVTGAFALLAVLTVAVHVMGVVSEKKHRG